jgi:hypothetical protein
MITSEQQVRLAIRFAGFPSVSMRAADSRVSPELMSRVLHAIHSAPDIRLERVAEARARLAAGQPSSCDIAETIIAGVISDALS